MKQCAIVIPVYKEELDCIEVISLTKLYSVIKNKWDVYLVCPEKLNTSNYYKIFPKLKTVEFDAKYFTSTAAYSQLCINYNFYNAFNKYEYMLIYQLDCYIFKDDIKFWCNKGYDYIGGPIVSTDCGWDTVRNKNKDGKGYFKPLVGNGGLSLRKIETFKELTDPNGEFRKIYKLSDEILSKVEFEDKYFCNDLYNCYDLYTPYWKDAFSFALDMSVDVIYELMKWDGEPMAIHAVDKNIRWWKNVLPEFKDETVINYCEEKHKDFFKLYYNENNSTYRNIKDE